MTTIELTLSDVEVERIAAAVVAKLATSAPAALQAPASDRFTVTEAAAALKCSTRQVRRLLSSGRLRATKLTSGRGSSRLLITRRSIDALLAEGG